DFDAETGVIREQLAGRAAFGDPDRLQNLEITARRFLALQARGLDRLDEGERAAVENGNFAAFDLDHDVIDAEADESRKQMLDGGTERAVLVAENGREIGVTDGFRRQHDPA